MKSKGFPWLVMIGLTVCFGLLAGCSQTPQAALNPKNPVTVDIWHYYNSAQKKAFDNMVAEFNETVGLEQGIIVEAYNQGNVEQLTQSVLDSAQKKVGTEPIPNIFAAYADTAYQVDKLGLVANLDDYLTAKEIEEYVPSYVEEGRSVLDRHLKIFPTAKSTEITLINRTDWDKFAQATGATTAALATWEGLAATAKAYYEWTDSLTPDIPNDGKAFFGRDAMANYFIIGCKQLGTEVFSVDNNGKVTFQLDEAVMRKLWNNYYVPYISGYYAANGRFRSDDAHVGQLIALVGSTSTATYFPQEVVVHDVTSYPIDAMVLPAPVFEGGQKVAVQQGAGMVVTKSTPQEEYASTVFLKWFTDAERNLEFSISAGYLPVKTAANNAELLATALNNNKETALTDCMQDTLRVAVDTVNTYQLYTNRAFDGGTEARAVLEKTFTALTKTDAARVRSLVDQGVSLEEAVAQVNTEEHFQHWLEQLRQQLADTQQGSE